MMTDDCKKWLEEQQNEFMRPFASKFTDAEANELFPEDEIDVERADLAGWYARLSAPGYMDATDWIGPFDSEDESLQALYETYGE